MIVNPKTSSRRTNPTAVDRRGSVLVLMSIVLPMMLILAAFAINSASIELRRTEMTIVSDIAARAGSRELTMSKSEEAARRRAKQLAKRNKVGNVPLTLEDSDIEFGTAMRQGTARYDFTQGTPHPNSVRIFARRKTGSADGPLSLPFPGILGHHAVNSEQHAISTQVLVDIALVIDRSGSMAYASNEPAVYPPSPSSAPEGWDFCDPAPPISRWRDMLAAVDVFTTEITNSPTDERVAVVTYNGSATIDQPLTADFTKIATTLDTYTQSLCAGGTNIGGGIGQGIEALINRVESRTGASKVIVVLTDGIHNQGTDPVSAAKQASSGGAMIFSVTFSDEADQNRMQKVAEKGYGKHFHAQNGDELKIVFAEIAKRMPTLLTK
ncbi:von Willebrand factor type A domain protein [Rosistilla carotiformis]|uniref:von Willebrand factor type A domain protein n=1 Tax=Rosistilla carotiformis TaxID=2528017 RepID=A0A518K107_9BACT|nr:VWA domain-containing protein [Rosistilla carotiformis]QDV71471.1 von Willebrand factor type A domain protein [Rosistilla carotiformis]